MNNSVNLLKKHESVTPSCFEENAKWRRENKVWLKWSRKIALLLVKYMEINKLSLNDLAERLDMPPQYVSEILSGKMNFSLKSIVELEKKLDIKVLNFLK
jgi:transcriptional regulator with XRE-family HTH domain